MLLVLLRVMPAGREPPPQDRLGELQEAPLAVGPLLVHCQTAAAATQLPQAHCWQGGACWLPGRC